jgi:hypothetical protein
MRLVAGRYAEIAYTRRVGGQAEVFQAADLHKGGRTVAIKLVPATADEINRIYFEVRSPRWVSDRSLVEVRCCTTRCRRLSRPPRR